jgi:uncharacterized MAPEG superfamily protein
MAIVWIGLLIACLMPIFCAGVAKNGDKSYDNNNPRRWYTHLEGYRSRAHAAQNNCHEALPFFLSALLSSIHSGVPRTLITLLSVLYVLCRMSYVYCYITDRAVARTVAWIVANLMLLMLFVLAVCYC